MSARARLVAACLLAGAGGSAIAADWTTQTPAVMTQISARAVGVTPGSLLLNSPVVGAGVVTGVGSGWQIVTTQQGPGPAGPVGVAVKRTLTKAALSRAIARSLPVVGGILTVKDLLDEIRCAEGFGGGVECDLGEPEITGQVFAWSYTWTRSPYTVVTGSAPSVIAAGAAKLAEFDKANSDYSSGNTTNWTEYKQQGTLGACTVGSTTWSCAATYTRQTRACNATTGCGGWSTTGPFGYTSAGNIIEGLKCAVEGMVKGIDGKCPTGNKEPVTELEFVERVDEFTPPTRFPGIIPDLVNEYVPIDVPQPVTTPEVPTVVGGRETTTNPDGSVKVRDTMWDMAPTPQGYGWTPRIVEKTYPPGTTPPPPGEIVDPETVTEGGTAPGDEIITCGLPNTPPCKIDEAETPAAVDPMADPVAALEPLGLTPAPIDATWSWSFALPSGCSVISVGEFAGHSLSVDLCEYQPTVHDIMSIVWLMTTVFAGLAIVGRTFQTGG